MGLTIESHRQGGTADRPLPVFFVEGPFSRQMRQPTFHKGAVISATKRGRGIKHSQTDIDRSIPLREGPAITRQKVRFVRGTVPQF